MADRSDRSLRWAWIAVAVLCLAVAVAQLAPVRPVGEQTGDGPHYVQAAQGLASGDGYVLADGRTPRYPPGLPVILAPFTAVGEAPGPVEIVPALAGVALVALIWWAAWSLAGPVAAAVAAIFIAASPGIRAMTSEITSDLPAACLLVAALIALTRRRRLLAGVLVGLGATFRLGHALFAVTTDRLRFLGSVVVLALLAVTQVLLLGSLLGYAASEADFSVRWLTQRPILGHIGDWSPYRNFELYPQLLMGRWGWLVPGLPLLALPELYVRRGEPAARFAVAVLVLNLFLYLAYFYQAYRFMLPAAVMLLVYASAAVGRGVRRILETPVAARAGHLR